LRTAKLTLLIASLALIFVQCGKSKVTHDAFAAMQKNKMVRIATDPVNVPFEFGMGTGVQGFDVDLGAEIAKDLGFPVKWVKVSFDRIFELLKNGEVEMIISTVGITEERKKELAFSDPYFDGGDTIARRRDNMAIKDLASLTGKQVGVQSERTGDMFMTAQKTAPNVTLTRFKTLDDALGGLNRGEFDAVVGDQPIITYSIYKSYATNLITTGVELAPNQYAVVLRPEETKLREMVNTTIARLKNSGELDRSREKWFQDVMQITKDERHALEKDAQDERQALEKDAQLKAAAKTISVNLVKESGSTVRLDRLDGFPITMVGANGSFQSTPILTDDAGVKGSCKFTKPIPPGEYKFTLSRIGVTQSLTVARDPVTAMTLILTFSAKGIVIDWK
jgi:ABC-type amino acid transport substrate-binding protein